MTAVRSRCASLRTAASRSTAWRGRMNNGSSSCSAVCRLPTRRACTRSLASLNSICASVRIRNEALLGHIRRQSMNDNTTALFAGNRTTLGDYHANHFGWSVTNGVGTITLDRPERKNPLTFESYAELRDLFRQLAYATDVKSIVIHGAGDNFCSGGDVHDIIAPLVDLPMPELLMFTRMTGDLVKAMRHCPQPIVSAVDGICAGAGAIVAMASDLRLGTARSKLAFLFTRVGLAGCGMGAGSSLPRIIGPSRATQPLFARRSSRGDEGFAWGFFQRLCGPRGLLQSSQYLARDLAAGPTFAHGITKKMLHQEGSMSVDEAIESEAQAPAICIASNA